MDLPDDKNCSGPGNIHGDMMAAFATPGVSPTTNLSPVYISIYGFIYPILN